MPSDVTHRTPVQRPSALPWPTTNVASQSRSFVMGLARGAGKISKFCLIYLALLTTVLHGDN